MQTPQKMRLRSIHLSFQPFFYFFSFLLTIPKQLGNHETCSHLRPENFFLPISYPVSPTPFLRLRFVAFYLIFFSPNSRCVITFSLPTSMSLFSPPVSLSLFHSLMLRGNSLPPLWSFIHHHPFLPHTHTHIYSALFLLTCTNPVCISVSLL